MAVLTESSTLAPKIRVPEEPISSQRPLKLGPPASWLSMYRYPNESGPPMAKPGGFGSGDRAPAGLPPDINAVMPRQAIASRVKRKYDLVEDMIPPGQNLPQTTVRLYAILNNWTSKNIDFSTTFSRKSQERALYILGSAGGKRT